MSSDQTQAPGPAVPLRERILEAAQALLAAGGVPAMTNRAIAAAAHTQPPVIYRVFGDKQGLLDAVAARQFQAHLAEKSALELTDDPVADLRSGWDQHVAFGLANPAVYVMVYGAIDEGMPVPAAQQAERMLAHYVHRVALAGRLRVPEALATQMMHAAGRGVTLTLLQTPPGSRDLALSSTAREATITAITTGEGSSAPDSQAADAFAARAELLDSPTLSDAERALLAEWLARPGAPGQPVAADQASDPRTPGR